MVAGASEGLGAAFSRCIARYRLNIVMLARRTEALEATAEAIRTAYGVQVRTLSLDLSSPDIHVEFERHIGGLEIGLLVYNAAYATIAPYHQVALEEKQRHLAVNCHGPVVLSSVLAPAMIRRGRGGMIFLSSATSLRGTSLLATYAATKAFNTVLAESLWQEFQPYGVDVLGVIAGATKTPNYERTQPVSLRFAPPAQDPDALARRALQRLGKGSPIWISNWQVGLAAVLLTRLLPRSAAVRFLSSTTRQTYSHFLGNSQKGQADARDYTSEQA